MKNTTRAPTTLLSQTNPHMIHAKFENVVANTQNADNVVANEVVSGQVWLLNFKDRFISKCNNLRINLIELVII